jgi:putative ABC transport system permease protein
VILRHALFLALHSLRHSWKRNALLACVLGVSLGLPLLLNSMLARASIDMRARTNIAPLLLGAKGSESDLVFGAMFFASTPPQGLVMRDLARVEADNLATAIPLVLGATARKTHIVGTSIDYFKQRALVLREGVLFALIGECVLGADVAATLELQLGATFFTDPADLANLAGVFPLELRVCGILPHTNSPDDNAIFTDLRTMWSIRGLGHRHEDPATSTTAGAVIGATKDAETSTTIAGEALPIERTQQSDLAPNFHFHGATSDFPLDGALVFPADAKSRALLIGRFNGADEQLQLIRPDLYADRVLNRIFGVARVLATIAYATAALVALVVASAFMLSMRLRADELALMQRLGASRGRVVMFVTTEAILLVFVGCAGAAVVSMCAPLMSHWVLRLVSGS